MGLRQWQSRKGRWQLPQGPRMARLSFLRTLKVETRARTSSKRSSGDRLRVGGWFGSGGKAGCQPYKPYLHRTSPFGPGRNRRNTASP